MIKLILLVIKNYKFRINWRKNNQENFTKVKKMFDTSNVSVGRGTYGVLNVKEFGSSKEGLIIGNYVSIAEDVLFLLGGNHEYRSISTYPFKNKYEDSTFVEALSNGCITIKDDVWIGNGVLIMSGVTIGQGSVLAAKSVITKDVPPYSIVAGVPGKIIKKRFSNELIEVLEKLNFNKISPEFYFSNQKIFNKKLENKDIEEVKELIRKLESGE